MKAGEILKEYWGYDHFRPLQEDIINAVLEGKDVLALLPTGGGKSVCFQVPALAKEGLCLVVSPLIALMKDQVAQLKKRGINALAVYSGMGFLEVKKTLQNAAYGNYKFLYVSPERLESTLFLDFLPAMNINLVAVDEAHCISQWGYDFRPPYTRIAGIRELLPGVPVLALTASATKTVQDDICDKLLFGKTQQRFQQSFERPNLSYSVFNVPAKQTKLLEVLKNVSGSAIVYCKSRRHTKEVADLLLLNSISADHYHAGLNNEERHIKQERWITNSTRVIVCTNAFGMGIDKPDVRLVVHYDIPDCIENYYQEAGRAGRDGKRAYAVLLYTGKEISDLQQQGNIRFPGMDTIKKIYTAIMNHLQVAAGSGEGMSYNFDMAAFTAAFKLPVLPVTYTIKALQQEDILSYDELFFKPSTVLFTTDKNSLTDFEQTHARLEPLIKGLLRSYEGIFDYPATVYESNLAKFVKKDTAAVKTGLAELHRLGIIHYEPQKDSPQLQLLQNRMYADNFSINSTDYLKRKENFEQRIQVMTGYVQDTHTCRSQVIAAYFSSIAIKRCGICDNCINQHTATVSATEFEAIHAQLKALTKTTAMPVKDILLAMPQYKKEKIWKVISYLQDEQKLSIDKNGNLSAGVNV